MKNGEIIYYCSKLSTPANGQNYAEPVAVQLKFGKFTVTESSGNSFIDKYGLNMKKQTSGVAQPYTLWNGVINKNDLFYLNGLAPSDDEDFYGQKANFRVSNVAKGDRIIRYTFENIRNE